MALPSLRAVRSRLIRDALPGDPRDKQSRYIEAAIDGIVIASIYLPNGNPHPGPKFDYKLAWFDRLTSHAADLLAQDVPVVLAGDYNLVPTDFDIHATRSYTDNALLQPAPRAAYAKLLASGWTDALRYLHPDDPVFTFWSYLRNRWPRDAGLRLDHLLLSPAVAPHLKAAGVDSKVRGETDGSDHAPAWIELVVLRSVLPRCGRHVGPCDHDMRVGIISDTHGLLRPEAVRRLAGVDHILHAENIGNPDVVKALGRIAPVTAVRGNVDKGAWAAQYPETATLQIAGLSIYLIHDIQDLQIDLAARGFDAVVSSVILTGQRSRPWMACSISTPEAPGAAVSGCRSRSQVWKSQAIP